jgi:hypothetical protein
MVRSGMASIPLARITARQARPGESRLGEAWRVMSGVVCRGVARCGRARQARQGGACPGLASRGQARQGQQSTNRTLSHLIDGAGFFMINTRKFAE